MTQSTNRLGRSGEDLAAQHLEDAGFRIAARNWRASVADVRGEIDIVAVDGATLVFCEVKARRTVVDDAFAAVTWSKQRQLRRLAGLYLAANPYGGDIRFDVVAVAWVMQRPVVHHIRGAF